MLKLHSQSELCEWQFTPCQPNLALIPKWHRVNRACFLCLADIHVINKNGSEWEWQINGSLIERKNMSHCNIF